MTNTGFTLFRIPVSAIALTAFFVSGCGIAYRTHTFDYAPRPEGTAERTHFRVVPMGETGEYGTLLGLIDNGLSGQNTDLPAVPVGIRVDSERKRETCGTALCLLTLLVWPGIYDKDTLYDLSFSFPSETVDAHERWTERAILSWFVLPAGFCIVPFRNPMEVEDDREELVAEAFLSTLTEERYRASVDVMRSNAVADVLAGRGVSTPDLALFHDVSDPALLWNMARAASQPFVGIFALDRLPDDADWLRLCREAATEPVRKRAFERLRDPKDFVALLAPGLPGDVRTAAVGRISDEDVLVPLVLNDDMPALRRLALRRIRDEGSLESFVRNGTLTDGLRLEALERIGDKGRLEAFARDGELPEVLRLEALERLPARQWLAVSRETLTPRLRIRAGLPDLADADLRAEAEALRAVCASGAGVGPFFTGMDALDAALAARAAFPGKRVSVAESSGTVAVTVDGRRIAVANADSGRVYELTLSRDLVFALTGTDEDEAAAAALRDGFGGLARKRNGTADLSQSVWSADLPSGATVRFVSAVTLSDPDAENRLRQAVERAEELLRIEQSMDQARDNFDQFLGTETRRDPRSVEEDRATRNRFIRHRDEAKAQLDAFLGAKRDLSSGTGLSVRDARFADDGAEPWSPGSQNPNVRAPELPPEPEPEPEPEPVPESGTKAEAAVAAPAGPKASGETKTIRIGTSTLGLTGLARYTEEGAREVLLDLVRIPSGLWFGKTEITQYQWDAVMGNNPSQIPGGDLPVDTVSWDDCRVFLMRLNALPAVCEAGLTFRLPTQEEWEEACRAGSKGDFGLLANGREGTPEEMAWHLPDDVLMSLRDPMDPNEILQATGGPHPVGTKKPNAWGLYDMHGNVWEWTSTVIMECAYFRGGAWNEQAGMCDAVLRDGKATDFARYNLGFRVCAEGAAERDARNRANEGVVEGLIRDMVRIPGKNYWMGKFEVSQAQWTAVMGSNPAAMLSDNPDKPITMVSFEDCQRFLNRLNALPAVRESGFTFRLPTANEWAFACRGGSDSDRVRLADGTDVTDRDLGRIAWYSGSRTLLEEEGLGIPSYPVGKKEPNAYGLHDMLGNVAEWTSTPYDQYKQTVCGGAVIFDAEHCRPSSRVGVYPNIGGGDTGLRLCAERDD